MDRVVLRSLAYLLLAGVPALGLSHPASNAELSPRDYIALAAKRMQGRLTEGDANRIAEGLIAVARRGCVVPWQVLLSIGFTESSLRRNAIGRLNPSTKDYGLMQINTRMIQALKLDKARLMQDEHYAFAVACRILGDTKTRYSKRYPHWIGFYRAGTATWKASTMRIAKDYHSLIMRRARTLGYR